MSGAALYDLRAERAVLEGATLRTARLRGAQLNDARASGADFSGAGHLVLSRRNLDVARASAWALG